MKSPYTFLLFVDNFQLHYELIKLWYNDFESSYLDLLTVLAIESSFYVLCALCDVLNLVCHMLKSEFMSPF